ncbi:hypothetical protein WR25_03772 [Diploscapter pachys]|uniref:Arrestin C-terminal-like domain-containing protein n=1 Tax=Diploscapter pachys TaxID=2018661 RepID=A0A2A2LND7_9BILA|nr:hypothetical protein WR25_03772 [Diploscapter pachys]
MIEMHLRIPEAVQVIDREAVIEGRCRASFANQDSIHTLAKQNIHIPLEPLLLPTSKGFSILPEGSHLIPLHFMLPQNLPGTLSAKSGAIAYRLTIKLKLKKFDNDETGMVEAEKVLDILGKVPLRCEPSYHQNVLLNRHIKKRVLCFNRLNAAVKLELQKAAFAVGEHVLVTGEIENQHHSHVIKHVAIEIRQTVLYTSGDAKKSE